MSTHGPYSLEEADAISCAALEMAGVGIEIRLPWNCDLDDLERSQFEGLVAACRAYAATNRDVAVALCRQAHSALDDALGDTDVSHVESDDALRQDHPVQWAAMTLAHAITLAHGWDSDDG